MSASIGRLDDTQVRTRLAELCREQAPYDADLAPAGTERVRQFLQALPEQQRQHHLTGPGAAQLAKKLDLQHMPYTQPAHLMALVDAGLSANFVPPFSAYTMHYSLLGLAIDSGQLDLVRALIGYGGDPNLLVERELAGARSQVATICAAAHGDEDASEAMVALLLEHGALADGAEGADEHPLLAFARDLNIAGACRLVQSSQSPARVEEALGLVRVWIDGEPPLEKKRREGFERWLGRVESAWLEHRFTSGTTEVSGQRRAGPRL